MSEETEPEKFHPLVELLLARMESNPQEFIVSPTGETLVKSHLSIVNRCTQYLTPEEKCAVTEGLREANLNFLHEALMKSILRDGDRP